MRRHIKINGTERRNKMKNNRKNTSKQPQFCKLRLNRSNSLTKRREQVHTTFATAAYQTMGEDTQVNNKRTRCKQHAVRINKKMATMKQQLD